MTMWCVFSWSVLSSQTRKLLLFFVDENYACIFESANMKILHLMKVVRHNFFLLLLLTVRIFWRNFGLMFKIYGLRWIVFAFARYLYYRNQWRKKLSKFTEIYILTWVMADMRHIYTYLLTDWQEESLMLLAKRSHCHCLIQLLLL